MNRFTRVLAGALAAVLAAGSLAACGEKKRKLPEKQVLDHVYKYETKTLATYDEVKWDEDAQKDFKGYTEVQDTVISPAGYAYRTVTVDKDYNTTAQSVSFGRFDGSDPVTVDTGLPAGSGDAVYFSATAVVPQGLAAVMDENRVIGEQKVDGETVPIYEQKTYLRIYGFDGAKLSETEITPALFGLADTGANGYFGVDRVITDGKDLYMTLRSDNTEATGKLFHLGADGSPKEPIALADGGDYYFQSLYFFGEGKLFASYYDQSGGGSTAFILDIATGKKTKVERDSFPGGYAVLYNSFGGPDGMYLFDSTVGVYKLDTDAMTQEMVCNFLNSDFIFSSGSMSYSNLPLASLGDGRFAALRSSTKKGKTTTQLSVLEPADPAALQPKYIITVASAGYAYDFEEQVVNFNLSSEEYRIKYVNYGTYNTTEDYTLGVKQLKADILAGNVPDILIADESFSAADYMNKGVFADLYTYIDKDETLTRDKFLPNILSASELNGKLYELPTSVYIFGMMGEKSRVAEFGGLTMREFADKVAALPDGVKFVRDGDNTRDQMLRMLFFINYADFINRADATCDFDNDDFRALLEFVKTVPEKSMREDPNFNSDTFDWDAYNNMYKEGTAIAQISGLTDFFGFENMSYTFGTLETDLVGLPSRDRNGYAFSATQLKFLLSAKSPFADEGWKFIRQFFTDDVQTSLEYGFPVTVSALNAAKQAALDKIEKRAAEQKEGTGEVNGYMVGDNGVTIPIYDQGTRYETAADVEHIYDIVMSTKKQLGYDESIYNVIMEEASAYFSGEKSVEEVTKLINNRVGIILTENR